MECDLCYNDAALRCPTCLVGKWCSDGCAQEDADFHKTVCFDHENPERAKVVAAYIACMGQFDSDDSEDSDIDAFIAGGAPMRDYVDSDSFEWDDDDDDMSIGAMIAVLIGPKIKKKKKKENKKKKKSNLTARYHRKKAAKHARKARKKTSKWKFATRHRDKRSEDLMSRRTIF